MLEAADQVGQEREPDARLYQMLLGPCARWPGPAARSWCPPSCWKLLAAEGVQPAGRALRRRCGEDTPLVAFDSGAGGLLCRSCRRGVAVSPEAVSLLQDVLGGRLNAALAEPASEATHEVDHLATSAMEHHLERRLRTVDALDHA